MLWHLKMHLSRNGTSEGQWRKRRYRGSDHPQLQFLNPETRSRPECTNPFLCIYTLCFLLILPVCCYTSSSEPSFSPRILHQWKLEEQPSSAIHFSLSCPVAAPFSLLPTPFCAALVRRDDTPVIPLPITVKTTPIAADKPAILYPKSGKGSPFLIGSDGSAAGGIKIFNLSNEISSPSLNQLAEYATGRTKLATTIYDISGEDFIAAIDMPDSVFRLFQVDHDGKPKDGRPYLGKVIEVRTVLGDWSAICAWRSVVTGRQYLYLFGKRKVVMFVVSGRPKEWPEVVEVCKPV